MTKEQLQHATTLDNAINHFSSQIFKIKEKSEEVVNFPIDVGRGIVQVDIPEIVEKLKAVAILELELHLDKLKVEFKNL